MKCAFHLAAVCAFFFILLLWCKKHQNILAKAVSLEGNADNNE